MKKGVLVSSIIPIFVVSLVLLKSAGAEAQKTYEDITSRQLRSLMMDDAGAGYAFALRCMSDYYRDRIDNGEIPDDELSIVGLADLFLSYFSQKPTYQDRQATELLAIAFKNVPSQIEEQKAIWSKALKAGQAYYSEMSPELAKAYFDALPDHQLPRIAFEQQVPVVEMAYGNLGSLKRNLKKANQTRLISDSVLLIFRMGRSQRNFSMPWGKSSPDILGYSLKKQPPITAARTSSVILTMSLIKLSLILSLGGISPRMTTKRGRKPWPWRRGKGNAGSKRSRPSPTQASGRSGTAAWQSWRPRDLEARLLLS